MTAITISISVKKSEHLADAKKIIKTHLVRNRGAQVCFKVAGQDRNQEHFFSAMLDRSSTFRLCYKIGQKTYGKNDTPIFCFETIERAVEFYRLVDGYYRIRNPYDHHKILLCEYSPYRTTVRKEILMCLESIDTRCDSEIEEFWQTDKSLRYIPVALLAETTVLCKWVLPILEIQISK